MLLQQFERRPPRRRRPSVRTVVRSRTTHAGFAQLVAVSLALLGALSLNDADAFAAGHGVPAGASLLLNIALAPSSSAETSTQTGTSASTPATSNTLLSHVHHLIGSDDHEDSDGDGDTDDDAGIIGAWIYGEAPYDGSVNDPANATHLSIAFMNDMSDDAFLVPENDTVGSTPLAYHDCLDYTMKKVPNMEYDVILWVNETTDSSGCYLRKLNASETDIILWGGQTDWVSLNATIAGSNFGGMLVTDLISCGGFCAYSVQCAAAVFTPGTSQCQMKSFATSVGSYISLPWWTLTDDGIFDKTITGGKSSEFNSSATTTVVSASSSATPDDDGAEHALHDHITITVLATILSVLVAAAVVWGLIYIRRRRSRKAAASASDDLLLPGEAGVAGQLEGDDGKPAPPNLSLFAGIGPDGTLRRSYLDQVLRSGAALAVNPSGGSGRPSSRPPSFQTATAGRPPVPQLPRSPLAQTTFGGVPPLSVLPVKAAKTLEATSTPSVGQWGYSALPEAATAPGGGVSTALKTPAALKKAAEAASSEVASDPATASDALPGYLEVVAAAGAGAFAVTTTTTAGTTPTATDEPAFEPEAE
ncbi:hypothetical protein HK405_012074 [Cladochytrium tenue]|nr:hypothetical protein HK405_012074 [Cladochytrium tenue]